MNENAIPYPVLYVLLGVVSTCLVILWGRYRAQQKDLQDKVVDKNKSLVMMQKALEETERRFHQLSEFVTEGIIIHKDGKVIDANASAFHMLGYRQGELDGIDNFKLVAPECLDQVIEHIRQGNETPYEAYLVKKDGRRILAEVEGRVSEMDGEPVRVVRIRDITARRATENALRATENHRKNIINNAPVILFAFDPNGIITLSEGLALSSLGLKPGQLVGRSIYDIYTEHPEITDYAKRAIDGETVNYEIEINNHVFQTNLKPVRDDDGKVLEVIGVSTEITATRAAEKARQQSEERYKTIVSSMGKIGQGIFIVDKDFTVQYMNDVMIDWYGNQVGKNCHESTSSLNTPCDHCRLKEVIDEGKTVHYRVGDENKLLDIVATPIKNADGSVSKLEIIRNITEEERALEGVRKLSQAVRQSPVTVVITDDTGNIEYANPKFEETTGYLVEEAIGKNPSILKSGETSDEEYRQLWETLTQGKTWKGEFRNIRKDGSDYWERATISPVKNDQGRITHHIAIKEDITQQKAAEKQLRLAAAVFDTASEAVMVTDQQNFIQMVNKAFCLITGYEEEEVIGKNPSILKSGRHGQEFYDAMFESIQSTGHWEGEIWNRRKSGEIYPEWLSITQLCDSKGRPERYVSLFSDITKRKRDEQKIRHQANFDSLTGLPNRSLFSDRFSRAIDRAERDKKRVALLFIDLDRFKHINDTLGHPAGDQLLQETAKRLLACVRKSDTVARLGGDEFTVILPDVKEIHNIEDSVIKILDQLSQPYKLEGNNAFVSGSIGVTVYPDDGTSIDNLLRNADSAMYRAKEKGRNGFQFFTLEMDVEAQERRKLEMALHKAVENNEFSINIQPIYDLKDNTIASSEVLLRWVSPDLGPIYPDQFIPMAEESGLIVPIGEWVLITACLEAVKWQDEKGRGPRVGVNFSPRQFQRENVPEMLRRVLLKTGFNPENLTIEITESLLIADDSDILRQLREIRDIGTELAIDDFGTGFSSLSYLKKFPITILKIDRSFIHDITEDADSTSLVKGIITMAKSLQLKVVAEGVETKEQADLLKSFDCDYVQGYYFNKPMLVEEFVKII